ncbi:MAG: zinc-ribbon domain-containing protein [Ruminococcus sp.]|nr:zinc-ribbon domain-containing protein [Ruminococcus sp.]
MFCSKCGNMLDDDDLFCMVCGKKVKRIPENNTFAPETSVNETETTIQAENLYTPENNSQPEFSPENIPVEENSEEKELEKFFGSTEPIQHISPEPTPIQTEEIEQMKKVMETHTREPLPDLVLRKKAETKKENPPEKIYQPEDNEEEYYNNTPEHYDDNSETQYINIKNNYNYADNNYDDNYSDDEYYDDYEPEYDEPPEYEDIPPYNPPQRERNKTYQPSVQEYRPTHIGTFRLFSAGIITFIAMIIVIAVSLIFCIKLGFSGTVVEKRINRLDMEKVLDAEYDGNRDFNKFLYDKSGFYNISYYTANENDFRNFVLNLDILDFMGENAGIYADYFLNNGQKPTLTSGDIAEYMSARSGLGWNEFSNMLYNLSDNKIDSILSVDSWEADTGFNFRLLNYMFSTTTLVILLAVVCVLMIWTAVIVDKRGKYLAGFYKNIFMPSGVILLVAGAVCFIAPPVVYNQTNHVVFYIISKLLTDFNLFIFSTGAFEFIVGIILGLIRTLIVRHERIYGDG